MSEGEFDLIARIRQRVALRGDVALGIGDDCALLVPPPGMQLAVTMDTLTLPGALVSGKVTFSDGETAIWMLDQTGRPGLDPDTPGYRPSQDDIMEFQIQLRALIQKSGL